VTPNQWNRGSPINSAIIDSTGTVAARTLAAGMMSGYYIPNAPLVQAPDRRERRGRDEPGE
jgi:hypothetical protein